MNAKVLIILSNILAVLTVSITTRLQTDFEDKITNFVGRSRPQNLSWECMRVLHHMDQITCKIIVFG
jgi:hypothetical protein